MSKRNEFDESEYTLKGFIIKLFLILTIIIVLIWLIPKFFLYKKSKQHEEIKENNIHIDTIHTNARDKGSYCKEHNFDLLIDDNIKQIQSAKNNGLKGILFNENKDYEGLQTNNWKDLYNIIKEL